MIKKTWSINRVLVCGIFAYVLAFYPRIMNAQRYQKLYDSILNLKIPDTTKILKISNWIEQYENQEDLLKTQELYSDLSKFCFSKKKYQKAIDFANKALYIQEKYIDTLPQLLNKTYNNLSVFYRRAGRHKDALQSMKKLVNLAYKDKYSIIAFVNGLKDHAVSQGDYFQALHYIQEAEQLIDNSAHPRLRQEYYRIAIAYSGIYIKLGSKDDYHKALTALHQADTLNQQLASARKKARNHLIIHNRFGQVYSGLKNYDLAIRHFEKALNDNPDLKKSAYQQASIFNNLGLNYFRNGRSDKAVEYYQKGLQLNPKNTALQDNLGDYYLSKAEFEKALLSYQKAIDFNLNIFEDHNYNTLPQKEVIARYPSKIKLLNDLKDKSKAWLRYYESANHTEYLEKALATIELADYLVDLIREESTTPRSRFFWRTKELDLYMLATSIAYELNAVDKAFYFMEKSKSLALLEDLTHEEAKKRAKLPEALIQEEFVLKKNIFETRKQLQKIDSLTSKQKERRIYQTKKRYQEFINSLEQQYPNYYRYKKDIRLVDIQEAQQKSKATQTSYLQYIISDKKGYGLLIMPEESHFFEMDQTESLQKEILEINKLLSHPWESKSEQQRFSKLSSAMYRRLIPKDPKYIQSKVANLVIIPDYTLQYLPFETLIATTENQKESRFLIEYFDVSYLYSFSLNEHIIKKHKVAPKQLLAMGPVFFGALDLPDLLLSADKINSVSKGFSSDIFLYENATKTNFIKKCGDYQILQLSSHANSLGNATPWIAFHDAKLTLNELYFVTNRASIVVLDACKTGTGKLQPGESALSLTRGFFHSGAKSVVSSLWNTNEKSSNEIIVGFYDYLKQGDNKAVALRKSKLDFIRSHQGSEKSPYYWGALIVTGDAGTINLGHHSWKRYGFLLLLVLLGLLLWMFKRK